MMENHTHQVLARSTLLVGSAILTCRHGAMHIRRHDVAIDCQLSLGETISDCQAQLVECTLKTWEILIRFCFHVVIISFSPSAWRGLETVSCLPCLTIFLWNSAAVL